jgi:hypothetical protein
MYNFELGDTMRQALTARQPISRVTHEYEIVDVRERSSVPTSPACSNIAED